MSRPDWSNPPPELVAALERWEDVKRAANSAAAAPMEQELLPGRLGSWWRFALVLKPSAPRAQRTRR